MKNRKTVIAGLTLALFLVLGALNCAYADFASIFTVGSNGSTTQQSTFTLDQTPWLYVELPEGNLNWASAAGSLWFYDSNIIPKGVAGDSDFTSPYTREFWLKLDNWDSVAKVGDWHVAAGYELGTPINLFGKEIIIPKDVGVGCTSFNVTAVPEPISTVLFVLGGATLAVRRLRKGRKT